MLAVILGSTRNVGSQYDDYQSGEDALHFHLLISPFFKLMYPGSKLAAAVILSKHERRRSEGAVEGPRECVLDQPASRRSHQAAAVQGVTDRHARYSSLKKWSS